MDWLWVVVMALRAGSPDPDDRWAVTLDALDRQRAVAFAEADARRLREVYVPGSPAAAADAATIASYAARDARVVGARLHVLTCEVLSSSARRVRLEVVDRLGGARVVWGDGSSRGLPRDRPTRRVVTLARTRDGWRVAGSVDVDGRG